MRLPLRHWKLSVPDPDPDHPDHSDPYPDHSDPDPDHPDHSDPEYP